MPIKRIITESLETLKDKAKESVKEGIGQLGKTVNPEELIKQATGVQQAGNELSDYLKNVGPNLTEEEIKKRRQEISGKDQKELEEARKVIQSTTPLHMKLPQRPKELRPYEKYWKDQEEKKQANIVQAKQARPLVTPTGVRKGFPARRKKITESFSLETRQNIKTG